MRPLLLLCGAFALPALAQPPLDLTAVEARSVPDLELGDELRLLADARLLSASTRTLGREGPTLSVEAGPRRAEGMTTGDLAAGFELPIRLDGGPARLAATALDGATALEAAARLEARARLRAAYAEAWLAGERARLLDEQARLGEEWLRLTRRRIEAGAAAPFEAALVEGDLLRTHAERNRAREGLAAAWAALRARADLPAAAVPLAPPVAAHIARDDARDAFARGLLARGLEARAALLRSSLDLERSLARERWSLAASFAREGEERVVRAGLAYRLPLGGETAARHAALAAAREAQAASTRVARAALEARLESALARAEGFEEPPDPSRFAEAIEAVVLRLAEGKEPPSSAILLRRQLVDATLLALERRRDAFLLSDEIDTLTKGADR